MAIGGAVFVLLLVLIAVAIPTFLGSQSATVPSLDSLLSRPPGPGYVIDRTSPLTGYLTPAQVEQIDGGTAMPKGGQMYASVWRDHTGNVVEEDAIEAPTVAEAEMVAAGLFNGLQSDGGQPFDLPGLSGRTAGVNLPATSNRRSETAAIAVRSRLALLFVTAGPDQPSDGPALVTRIAASTAASLSVDSGAVNSDISSSRSAPVAYRMGEVLGALFVAGLIVALSITLVRRSRRR